MHDFTLLSKGMAQISEPHNMFSTRCPMSKVSAGRRLPPQEIKRTPKFVFVFLHHIFTPKFPITWGFSQFFFIYPLVNIQKIWKNTIFLKGNQRTKWLNFQFLQLEVPMDPVGTESFGAPCHRGADEKLRDITVFGGYKTCFCLCIYIYIHTIRHVNKDLYLYKHQILYRV